VKEKQLMQKFFIAPKETAAVKSQVVHELAAISVVIVIHASAAARWRGCVYVLQSVFFCFLLFYFFRPPQR